jgi:pilus assembly protein CpaB
MTRGTRTVVVLAGAALLATAASFAVYRAMLQMPVIEKPEPTRPIVLAKRAMPAGTLVTKDDVVLATWPVSHPLAGAIDRIETVTDRGLILPVGENEPITETKLAPRGAGAGLPPTIPTGMRALSVRVDEVIGVAGFVVPGTHVDVVVTAGRQNESVTCTVVDDVLVLTAGTRYDQEEPKKDGKAIPSSVVTLAVSPEDSQKVVMAQAEGRIMLALRNPLDTGRDRAGCVRINSLIALPAPPAPRRPPTKPAVEKPQPVAPPHTVEAIRGGQRKVEPIKGSTSTEEAIK